jgi:hypothetical protein
MIIKDCATATLYGIKIGPKEAIKEEDMETYEEAKIWAKECGIRVPSLPNEDDEEEEEIELDEEEIELDEE